MTKWRGVVVCSFLVLGALLGGWPASATFAEDWARFDPTLSKGARCLVDIAALHPTQFSLGLKEVEVRAAKLRKLNSVKLDNYLSKHIAPIVIGPGRMAYLLDHHHLARAVFLSGAKGTLYAEVKENWGALPEEEFWVRMQDRHWVYLFDEKGKGPLKPSELPHTIEAMRDDPYRSLAWFVREKGGYLEDQGPYSEFAWANFFRARVRVGNEPSGYDEVVTAALALAHGPEAQNLPGYISPESASLTKDLRP